MLKAPASGPAAVTEFIDQQIILSAYKQGYFPWPSSQLPGFIPWYSPDPRGVILNSHFKIPRSLRKVMNKNLFTIKTNQNFLKVVNYCRENPNRPEESWINSQIIQEYELLFKKGKAYSVESYFEDRLVGGIYGIQIGRYFSGESMFYLEPNASKVALGTLLEHLFDQLKINCFDTQMVTEVSASFGAEDIPRYDFYELLKNCDFNCDLPQISF
jgi:leucyl/phenylalanyl-tRNA--protein transferase